MQQADSGRITGKNGGGEYVNLIHRYVHFVLLKANVILFFTYSGISDSAQLLAFLAAI